MPFEVRTDRTLIRTGARSTRYLLVSYVAPVAPPRAERLPVNVALVLDRSGSMSDARKFSLARDAVVQTLRMLRPEDRFSLVVFDTEIDTIAAGELATRDAIRRALHTLDGVEPRGGTDLGGGWFAACEALLPHLSDASTARVLLLTDGQANHGETDPTVLAGHALELRRRGVATSTFGVGADFDERLLERLAHEGGGNFYYVSSPEQIPTVLTGELGEALETTARGATIELSLPSGVSAKPLNRFHHSTTREEALRVRLGDLVSGQEIKAALRIELPLGEAGTTVSVKVLLYGDGTESVDEEATLSWRYASHAENDAQPRDWVVDREVATLYVARARAEALEANRNGNFAAAHETLVRTARRIRQYAGRDTELLALVRELGEEAPRYSEAMDAMAMKQQHHRVMSNWKGRDDEGRARRGG